MVRFYKTTKFRKNQCWRISPISQGDKKLSGSGLTWGMPFLSSCSSRMITSSSLIAFRMEGSCRSCSNSRLLLWVENSPVVLGVGEEQRHTGESERRQNGGVWIPSSSVTKGKNSPQAILEFVWTNRQRHTIPLHMSHPLRVRLVYLLIKPHLRWSTDI